MWAPVFLTQSVLTSFPFRKASLKACHDDSLQICAARAAPHPTHCRGPAASDSEKGDVMSESIRGNLHSGGKKRHRERRRRKVGNCLFPLCIAAGRDISLHQEQGVSECQRCDSTEQQPTAAELTSAGQELFGANPQHCEAPSALL